MLKKCGDVPITPLGCGVAGRRRVSEIPMLDYASQREDLKPKGMPQVLKTIEKDAPGNAVAQRFLVEMNARAESVAAVKGAQ